MAATLTPATPSRWPCHHHMQSNSSNTRHVEADPIGTVGQQRCPSRLSFMMSTCNQPSTAACAIDTTTSSRTQAVIILGDGGLGWESTCAVNVLRITDFNCYAKHVTYYRTGNRAIFLNATSSAFCI